MKTKKLNLFILLTIIVCTCRVQIYAQTKQNPLERYAVSNLSELNTFAINPDFSIVPGTVVINHSFASSKKYIGSPSICILPDGKYIASHDFFGANANEKTAAETHIFSSIDKGLTWKKIATVNAFWSGLFYYNNALYLMGTRNNGVSCVIRKSIDGGTTWTEPIDSDSGLIREGTYHTAPTAVLFAQGKIWRAMEANGLNPVMFSAPIGSDLLKSSSWTRTNLIPFPRELSCSIHREWLEGNPVERVSDGKIINILRVNGLTDEIGAFMEVSDPLTIAFDKENFIRIPGASKKFTIRYDELSGKYYALVNWVPENMRDKVTVPNYTFTVERTRNTVAVATSLDTKSWKVEYVAIQGPDPSTQAFQYIDWLFEDDDIILVSRTSWFDGMENAASAHNANFMTFHRIKNFRNINRLNVD